MCQLWAANTAQARRRAAKIADAVIHITEAPVEINSWPSASCCGQPLTAPPFHFLTTTEIVNHCNPQYYVTQTYTALIDRDVLSSLRRWGRGKITCDKGQSQRKLSSSRNQQRSWSQIIKPVYAPDGNFSALPGIRMESTFVCNL